MLLYKTFGIALIILSAAFLGFEKAKKHNNRVNYLEKMQLSVNNIQNEIQHTLTPLPHLFKKISNSTDGVISEIFYTVHKKMSESNGESFQKIWKKSVSENADKLFHDDIELIYDFCDCISVCDISSQMANMKLYSQRLAVCIENARRENEAGQKLYKTLGIYLGVLLAILLI